MKKCLVFVVLSATVACFAKPALQSDPGAYMPVDWHSVRNNRAGTKTVWIGRLEDKCGMKWTAGFTMLKNRDMLTVEYIFMNQKPYMQPEFHCNQNTNYWEAFLNEAYPGFAVETNASARLDLRQFAPYETRRVKQYLYPVKKTDGAGKTVFGAVAEEQPTPSAEVCDFADGIRYMRDSKFDEAEQYFRKVMRSLSVTNNLVCEKNAAAHYYLALALRDESVFSKASGSDAVKLKEAEENFRKASLCKEFQMPAFFELARMACCRGKYDEALTLVDRAIDADKLSAKAYVLKAYICRKLDKGVMASKALRLAKRCDPLNYSGIIEEAFLLDDGEDAVRTAEKQRSMKVPLLLDAAYDYLHAGAYNDILVLMKEARETAEYYKTPAVEYLDGYAAEKTGDIEGTK